MTGNILILSIEALCLTEYNRRAMQQDKHIQTNDYPQGQKQLHALRYTRLTPTDASIGGLDYLFSSALSFSTRSTGVGFTPFRIAT